jgi:hypothetical protein
MSGSLRLSILIEAIDRASRPMQALQARLAGVAAGVLAVGAATQRLGAASGATVLAGTLANVAGRARDAAGAVAGLAGRIGLLGAGGAFALNRLLVRPAADFQNFGVTLETVMGNVEAAQRRLAELTQFASRTPFSVNEVVAAGVQLQVLGIRGAAADRALRAAGDAASVFPGARLADTIGALGAALRGEMDPLERFGIQAQTVGNDIVMRWERNGRLIEERNNKTNRRAIAATIARAWGDVAPNGMERRAETWDGMLSNLGDAWENFRRRIAQSGPFDWLQGQLRDLLALVSRLEADGTLTRWANETGAAITRAFQAVRDFVVGTDETPGVIVRLQAVFERLGRVIAPVVKYFGGLETFLAAVGLVLAGPLIGALVSLTTAMAALGVVLALTPAGWFAVAAAGIVALGKVLYDNWDSVAAMFDSIGEAWRRFADSEQIQLVRQAFGAAADWISERWGEVSAAFTGFGNNVRRTLGEIAGYFQPVIDAVTWLLDKLPSLGGGGGQPAGPTPRERGAGNALRRQSIYGPDALPGGAGAAGALPPANDGRVSASLDVVIRAPEGFGASVTQRGADDGLALSVRRGLAATP